MIKLLIVDDSAFMRMAIAKMVEKDPEIKVVGEAVNGEIAVQLAQELRPDVITMDVEMPIVDGLQAVKRIMSNRPCPIIMVSSLTTKGAQATINALELGAVDFIAKSSSFVQLDIVKIENELQEKIYYWGRNPLKLKRLSSPGYQQKMQKSVPTLSQRLPNKSVDIILIAVSTGGPKAVLELLKNMGKLTCPTVIAQHMPKEFTPGFAEHLALESGLEVVEGSHGMVLNPGVVYVAPGGVDSQIRKPFGDYFALDVKRDDQYLLHPSADLLFQSGVRNCESPVAVILTGMGDDGMRGACEFARRGYPVIVQEPSSCVVDGMPGSAIASGSVSEVLEVSRIARNLRRWCGDREDDVYSKKVGFN